MHIPVIATIEELREKNRRQYLRKSPESLLKQREAQRNAAKTPKTRYRRAINQAKIRKFPWTITFQDYSAIISQPCFYCEGVFGASIKGIGLDRIDSLKGYSIDNVVSCCTFCNALKGHRLTLEETEAAIEAVIKVRFSKS